MADRNDSDRNDSGGGDSGGGDDRSMGEILASIRKIVTEEERARREAEEARRRGEDPVGVLVLTSDMRVWRRDDHGADNDDDREKHGGGGVGDDEPLELGPDDRAPADPAEEARGDVAPRRSRALAAAVDFHPPAVLSETDVEDIVRRIVREELKGPVGQQISRRVKGIVADEVRRMKDERDDGLL